MTSGGDYAKTSLDPIFLQAVLMMVVIVLLTVWIR
ncbi:magnesium transporter protection protein MgtU [Klebsiella aerogenes]|nr:magnesium transporter protection protein MgtU [Klebsiella aerogenes]